MSDVIFFLIKEFFMRIFKRGKSNSVISVTSRPIQIGSNNSNNSYYNINIPNSIRLSPEQEEICKLCVEVLLFVKNNSNISKEEFENICKDKADAVLLDLKRNKIGKYVKNYKSIWSINKRQIDIGLERYYSLLSQQKPHSAAL